MNFKKNVIRLLFLVFISQAFASCQGQENQNRIPIQHQNPDQLKESLIDANKKRMQEESKNIDNYIALNNYKMNISQTGIRMMIVKEGNGPQPKLLSDISIKYKINLLDGTYIYSSDSSGILSFIVGQSNEPSGLQEAVLSLKEGSKSIIIIPYYLAYGLTGDGDKIGAAQSLVYQLELLKVRNN